MTTSRRVHRPNRGLVDDEFNYRPPTRKVPTMKRCPQCGRKVTVTEPSAFRGMDKLRSTLSCGHVILKEHIHDWDIVTDVNDRPLPDWAINQFRKGITVIPNGVEPEVWAAQNGLV